MPRTCERTVVFRDKLLFDTKFFRIELFTFPLLSRYLLKCGADELIQDKVIILYSIFNPEERSILYSKVSLNMIKSGGLSNKKIVLRLT